MASLYVFWLVTLPASHQKGREPFMERQHIPKNTNRQHIPQTPDDGQIKFDIRIVIEKLM